MQTTSIFEQICLNKLANCLNKLLICSNKLTICLYIIVKRHFCICYQKTSPVLMTAAAADMN